MMSQTPSNYCIQGLAPTNQRLLTSAFSPPWTYTKNTFGAAPPKGKSPHMASTKQRFLVSSPSSFVPIVVKDERGVQGLPQKYRTPPPSPPFGSFCTPTKASTGRSLASPMTASTYAMTPESYNFSRHHANFSPIAYQRPPRAIACCHAISANTNYGARSPSLSSTTTPFYMLPSTSSNAAKWRPRSPREDGDPIRRSKIKTELCVHYINNTPCPFRDGCTYAHGEEELQLTTLMDLQNAGLVDIETFRTKPCFTWVSTGSCPFGKRCSGIHDPRVAGVHTSWLTHTETQGNTISTDINVDGLHQKILGSILHDNPFGEQFSLKHDSYNDVYKLICNTTTKKKKRSTIFTRHKIDIALKMRGGSDWQFKFLPQHIIYDKVCMILQKRAFRLTTNGAEEISLRMYNDKYSDHVVVHEIAFGPDCDPAVRGVFLWFNINDSDVIMCTPQQAKRYRWKRNPKNRYGDKNISSPRTTPSVFDIKDCFAMIRPSDKETFDLTTGILIHYLQVLKASNIANICERADALEVLNNENLCLEVAFKNLRRHWVAWAWPADRDHDNVRINEDTPAPKVDSLYSTGFDLTANTSSGYGEIVDRIWSPFVQYGELADGGNNLSASEGPAKRGNRLGIFSRLAGGLSASPKSAPNYVLHITTPSYVGASPLSSATGGTTHQTRQSERCWKALLINETGMHETNEWEVVRHHFKNSRINKVLTILQQ